MKKKSLYMLTGLAIVPIAALLIFNSLGNRREYKLGNETGDRKVIANTKIEMYDTDNNYYNPANMLTLTAEGLKSERKEDMHLYGQFFFSKENKDLLRGKTINDRFISENDNYSCYACVEEDSQRYIDLNIKNQKSKSIIRKQYNLEMLDNGHYSTSYVKVSGNFVNVVIQKTAFVEGKDGSADVTTFINYKFDLASGNFLKKYELGKNIDLLTNDSKEKLYYVVYENSNKKNEDGKNYNTKLYAYNFINDTVEEIKVPSDMAVNGVKEYEGNMYLIDSNSGTVQQVTQDGESKKELKLIDVDRYDHLVQVDCLGIKDNKIYFTKINSNNVNGKVEKSTLMVFSLADGKQLYSADITSKGMFENKEKTAQIWNYRLS